MRMIQFPAMAAVSWLLQRVADVPATDEWLSRAEREVLGRFWVPKRIREWRLGRWTAKRALARAGIGDVQEGDLASLARIMILADDAGKPRAFFDDRESAWLISLTHSSEHGACAVARDLAALGCDLETIGRRGEEFVVDWFTEAEREMVDRAVEGRDRSRLATLVWSAKESALKALGVGLRLDTREVRVEVGDEHLRRFIADRWAPLVVHAPDRPLHGWWRADAERVLTLVAHPPPASPRCLGPEPVAPSLEPDKPRSPEP